MIELDTRYAILDTTMITITDKAKSKIDHLMQDSEMGSDYFLRVSVKGVVVLAYLIIWISTMKFKKEISFLKIVELKSR